MQSRFGYSERGKVMISGARVLYEMSQSACRRFSLMKPVTRSSSI